ncbi:MAG: FadR family transcriptional regulator [Rhodobacteraceae bacterium]|nr:FadR family transcriptional regulator [Paracoccaceae bacterium]
MKRNEKTKPELGLASHIRHRLDEMLNEPQWSKGGRLPPEAELAEQVGVSRPTLRKALAELRESGRVVAVRGSGNFVQPVAALTLPEPHRKDLSVRTVFDMKRCIHFRTVVECAAAEEAARQRNADAIGKIKDALEEMRELTPGESVFERDFAFHLAVADASINPYFGFVLETIREQIRLTIEFTRELGGRPADVPDARTIDEHQAIVDAIEIGNADAAGRAMGAHMERALYRLLGE